MKYDKLCEMELGDLMGALMGKQNAQGDSAVVSKPIQPDDNVGEFGNEGDIHIKLTPEGGIEVDSKEMAFKISSDVYEAIKSFVTKGE